MKTETSICIIFLTINGLLTFIQGFSQNLHIFFAKLPLLDSTIKTTPTGLQPERIVNLFVWEGVAPPSHLFHIPRLFIPKRICLVLLETLALCVMDVWARVFMSVFLKILGGRNKKTSNRTDVIQWTKWKWINCYFPQTENKVCCGSICLLFEQNYT